jgi:uncharacterized membrane protein
VPYSTRQRRAEIRRGRRDLSECSGKFPASSIEEPRVARSKDGTLHVSFQTGASPNWMASLFKRRIPRSGRPRGGFRTFMRSLGMARAPGGKAGADSPSVHRDTSRLVAFSHAVFAITITLLVLEIRPPTDDRNLLHGLVALWPSYVAYSVTFLFIGQVWANHHVLFDHIRAADRVVLLLNTLLLMVVAFLPFATSVLAGALRSGHGQRTAVVLYGITFDVTALTFNGVWQYASRQGCSAKPLTLRAPQLSAGAFSSLWPGSRVAPCLAPCYPSWAWP